MSAKYAGPEPVLNELGAVLLDVGDKELEELLQGPTCRDRSIIKC